ncbi:hypothetical protein [Aliiglaciecola lipolytica]|uniref:Lipoprotein n=1 Tax=Aliiglaciecola lipolytica E3 TaxID=1127673 RepID=K6YQT5_9ALTE|nr:hypothetical protein [Aliiglaciecola lipolytica]GAC13685.1 hypothetical protein GLIP_1043 [Aliiglaciecola lipolytica E3]
MRSLVLGFCLLTLVGCVATDKVEESASVTEAKPELTESKDKQIETVTESKPELIESKDEQIVEVTELKPEISETKVEQRIMMLGRWYGDTPTKEGGRKQWIIDRAENGTYTIDFLVTKANKTKQQFSEKGIWGVAGNIYFSIYQGATHQGEFHPSDPSDPYNYDAYHIINITSVSFEYQNIDSQNKYMVSKVPASFVLGKSEL